MDLKKRLEISLRHFFIRHDWLKKLIELLLLRTGWNIIPGKSGLKFIRFTGGEGYYPNYSPWRETAFTDYFETLAEHTTTRPVNMWLLQRLVATTAHLDGEFWQVGVYRGGGAVAIETILASARPDGATLRLFDTFAGLAGTDPAFDVYEEGMLDDTSIEAVRALLKSKDTHVYAGMAPDCLQSFAERRLAFSHLDIDAYSPSLETLMFLAERTVPGGGYLGRNLRSPERPWRPARRRCIFGADGALAHRPAIGAGDLLFQLTAASQRKHQRYKRDDEGMRRSARL